MVAIIARLSGRLSEILRAELAAGEKAVTAGIRAVTDGAKADLRGQIAAAFGDRGRSLATTWRSKVYPETGESMSAAGIVWSAAPAIIDAFDRGATIRAARAKFLAIPTGFNRETGRRGAKPRVSPADMVASRQAFLVPFRQGGGARGFLWCLKVSEASSAQRTRSRRRADRMVIAANRWDVATGKGGGRRADGTRRLTGRQIQERLLSQGFVPMFVLLRQVRFAQRIDVRAVARRWAARMPQEIVSRWRAPEGRAA